MVKIAFYDTAQLPIIKSAKEKREWFTAIVLSATQLELNGCMQIKAYFRMTCPKIEDKVIDALLEPLYLRDVANCLLVMEIIDKKDYDSIMKVNSVRNDFVHRREMEKFKRGKEADKIYRRLVEEAERILKDKLNVVKMFVAK